MRHSKRLKKLGLKKSHRDALVKNLMGSLITNGRLRTIENRAKVLAARFGRFMRVVQKKEKREMIRAIPLFITGAGKGKELGARIDALKTKYANRTSGFTRMTPVGLRKGDNAKVIQIELI